jgi:DNA-binding MarR family transcriptional regulator
MGEGGVYIDYEDLITKIRKIVRSINLESKKVQKQFGISIPQLLCLRYLSQSADYKSNTKNIRKQLNLNSSTVTGIINRLEQKGYIARLPSTTDKRVTVISLTAIGLKLITDSPVLLDQRLTRQLNNLPEDDIERIHVGLDLLVRSLEIQDLEASPLLTIDDPKEEG